MSDKLTPSIDALRLSQSLKGELTEAQEDAFQAELHRPENRKLLEQYRGQARVIAGLLRGFSQSTKFQELRPVVRTQEAMRVANGIANGHGRPEVLDAVDSET